MYCNIMEIYINFIENNILEYLKLILENNYDKKIAIELTKTYIDARYYNYGSKDKTKYLSTNVFNELKLQYERLKNKHSRKTNIIEETFSLFKYIFYIDGIKKDKTLEQVVKAIVVRRFKKYKISEENNIQFEKNFLERINNDNLRKTEFLKKFDTDKFDLIIKQNNYNKTIFDVSIKSNVKFKEIFKEDAIENAFNKGLIAEDKLIVEYNMITTYIIKDIIKGNFEKKYLINYTASLLKKKRKNKQILNIIADESILSKLILKITYKQFLRNKYEVYDLMKNGYKFAVIVDKENNIDNTNLNMFKYILVVSEHPKLDKYINKLKNVIIVNQ